MGFLKNLEVSFNICADLPVVDAASTELQQVQKSLSSGSKISAAKAIKASEAIQIVQDTLNEHRKQLNTKIHVMALVAGFTYPLRKIEAGGKKRKHIIGIQKPRKVMKLYLKQHNKNSKEERTIITPEK